MLAASKIAGAIRLLRTFHPCRWRCTEHL